MLYTFYNAMGSHSATWKNGSAVRRSDGSPWIHIQLTVPDDMTSPGFWPWRAELVTETLESCPCGDYYMECWDVYRNGIFQRTEDHLR